MFKEERFFFALVEVEICVGLNIAYVFVQGGFQYHAFAMTLINIYFKVPHRGIFLILA
jgi:ABC-type sulfate transport system permease component